MMRDIRLALVPALFVLTGIAYADQPAPAPRAKEDAQKSLVETCDRLAALAYDTDRPPTIPPVAFRKIDGAAATKACTEALPEEKDPVVKRRMHLLRARGLLAEKKMSEAIAEYRVAAEAGSVAAAGHLGEIYETGEGVTKDYATARTFFEQAAAHGNADAMVKLAGFYMLGKGVPADLGAGREWLMKAAALGDAYAMADLGGIYLNGEGVPKDTIVGMAWLKKGEATGDRDALGFIGFLYLDGRGVPKNETTALQYFEKAANLGDPQAMAKVGDLFKEGRGAPRDQKRAHDWYQKALDSGNDSVADKLRETSEAPTRRATPTPVDAQKARVEACDRLAAFDHDADRPKSIPPVAFEKVDGPATTKACTEALAEEQDPIVKRRLHFLRARGLVAAKKTNEAIADYRIADEAGSVAATYRLGTFHLTGEGVTRDYAAARRFFEKAAAHDDAPAMTALGAIYTNGQGAPQDLDAAREWLVKAAALDDGAAMVRLASLYLNGTGVPKNTAVGMGWLKKAEATGSPEALSSIGSIYLAGKGVAKDEVAGRRYLEKAADLGQAFAMERLGDILREGRGVPRDMRRAHEWYQKALNAGNTRVTDRLEATRNAPAAAETRFAAGPAKAPNANDSEQKARVEACDRLAAQRDDLDRPSAIPPVDFRTLDAAAAISACNGALEMEGDPTIQRRLRFQLARGLAKGLRPDEKPTEVMAQLRLAADAGSAEATTSLAMFQVKNARTVGDVALARTLYEKAAGLGSVRAMSRLGDAFAYVPPGVGQDYGLARQWWLKAAERDDAEAMIELGLVYYNSLGVPFDETASTNWFKKAAATDDTNLLCRLGDIYLKGEKGPLDYDAARAAFQKSALMGAVCAMKPLGDIYSRGYGVTTDTKRAIAFYEKAARSDPSDAALRSRIDELRAK